MEAAVTQEKAIGGARYVKLGRGGAWEEICLGEGNHSTQPHTLRLGFWTDEEPMFTACLSRDWEAVAGLLREKRGKGPRASVADDLRQIEAVFADDGTTLWITFHNRCMYWGYLDATRQPEVFPGGSIHHLRAPGWSDHTTDDARQRLLLDDLPGHLGQVAQYRQTVCKVRSDYVRNRIAGKDTDLAVKARERIEALERSIIAMMQDLTPYDFEVLVDMTFAASGWRRQGGVGGTEKDVDLVLIRSSIGASPDQGTGSANVERVGVQIKSQATTSVFNRVASKLERPYDRALFVHHTGDVDNAKYPDVEVVGPEQLAPMVLDAGLTRWLFQRVR